MGLQNERYEYVKTLGKGGSGSVFLARDRKLDKLWAVKELTGQGTGERNRELEVLKKLSCPAFPRIVDVISENGKTCLVMDYVEGVSLRSLLKNGPMKEKEVTAIALQMAEGLAALHNSSPQMLYMDCKPDNILMDGEGNVRFIDLGSVYFPWETENGKDRQKISGTFRYAPFEQRTAKRGKIGVATDVYAFGMTLATLLLGKEVCLQKEKQFHIRNYNPSVSRGMDAILCRCLQPDERKRFQTMEEITDSLRQIRGIGRISSLRNSFFEKGKLFLQSGITVMSLYCLNSYAMLQRKEEAAAGLLLFLLLVILCFQQGCRLWEVKKSICFGMGNRIR